MLSPQGTETLARVVIVALLLAPVLLAVWGLARSKHTATQEALIFLSALLARTLWRARVKGRIDIPAGQGAIVVANHTSGVDPWFTKLASPRILHYLVASEYFYHPAMHWFFRQVEAIPVNRGGIDTAATKQAIRLAEQGHVVGIFPEGRINPTRSVLLPGRPGALLVALKARVPVQICYIFNAPQSKTVGGTFLTPSKTRIVVGPLLDISEYFGREKEDGVLAELTLRVLKEIATLAGQPDFQPKLAGKNWKPRDDE
ncbi:MAG: lysophospholipid acyltransferase family protein [Pirellulales bacterium]